MTSRRSVSPLLFLPPCDTGEAAPDRPLTVRRAAGELRDPFALEPPRRADTVTTLR